MGKIWDLWWDGDQHPQRRYAPYRSLCPKYDLGFAPLSDPTKINPDKKNFHRAKKVIEAIMSVGHVTSADVLAMSKTDRDACFSAPLHISPCSACSIQTSLMSTWTREISSRDSTPLSTISSTHVPCCRVCTSA